MAADRNSVSGSTHLRGIAIAGALAALALAGAFLTFAMNQDASKAATPPTILPLKDRHPAMAKVAPKVTPATTVAAKAKPKVKAKPKPPPVDPNLKAALAAGLPRTIAEGLAQSPVAVVELSSDEDTVSEQATAEAKAGAQLGGAAFVSLDVDKDSTTVQALARLLEQVPDAPAALIYTRPATLALTLTGYVDQTVVAQAVANADPALAFPPSSVQMPASWASKANALCAKVDTQIQTLKVPSDPYAVTSAQAAKWNSATGAFLSSFKALTPAPGKTAEVNQLNTFVAGELASGSAALADAAKKKTAAVSADQANVAAFETKANTLDRELGATSCVDA